MPRKINAAGLALIKAHEGLRLEAYRDPVGVWTIGWGHTSSAGPPQVKPGMRITKAEAEEILRRDLGKFEEAVSRAVKVELNENQFSALVSFTFNVGEGAFRRSSVLARVNEGNFSMVPSRLALWNKGGGKVLPGLVRRRREEGELFMRPEPKPDDVLMVGYIGPHVTALQQELKRLNYHPGGIDGIFGNLTRDALMAFQADNGLKVDGMAGDRTWAALKTAQPRPLMEERKNATTKELVEKGSEITDASEKGKKGAIATILGGISAAATQVIDHAGGFAGIGPALEPFREIARDYGVWMLGTTLVLAGTFFWWQARRSGKARLEDHQQGRTL